MSSPSPGLAPIATVATPKPKLATTIQPGSSQQLAAATTSTSFSSVVTTEPFHPLTTHWDAPPRCTWTYDPETLSNPEATGAVAWLDMQPVPGALSLSCYPDGMFASGRTGTFSPATCPGGWTTVSLNQNTEEDADQATTTAICCSSEYTLDKGYCKRSVATAVAVPISYNSTASTYEVLSSSTVTLYGATMAAYTIQALFRESDIDALGLTDADDIDDHTNSPGLSLGSRVGIGIGVAGIVALAIALGVFCFCRERRRNPPVRVIKEGRHDFGPVGMSTLERGMARLPVRSAYVRNPRVDDEEYYQQTPPARHVHPDRPRKARSKSHRDRSSDLSNYGQQARSRDTRTRMDAFEEDTHSYTKGKARADVSPDPA